MFTCGTSDGCQSCMLIRILGPTHEDGQSFAARLLWIFLEPMLNHANIFYFEVGPEDEFQFIRKTSCALRRTNVGDSFTSLYPSAQFSFLEDI